MNPSAADRQLTELDHLRLSKLLLRSAGAIPACSEARELLDQAEVVGAEDIAATVVTMRSRVRIARAGGAVAELVLAYPQEADAAAGLVSVLSPLGLGLLGARRGATIEWAGPTGERHRACVTEILYQPEAAGDLGS